MDISIIIPIYNVKEWLLQCLDSVATAVECIDAEVLLIDDGSSDGSSELATSYVSNSEHSKFRYYYKENSGPGDTRNFGIGIASGKYITFTDADDVVSPDMYRDLLAGAEFNNAEVAVCDVMMFRDGKNPTRSWAHNTVFYRISDPTSDLSQYNWFVNDASMTNKLIRKDFLERYNIKFEVDTIFEDAMPAFKVYYYAQKIAVLRSVGYYYRIRTGKSRSITQGVGVQQIKEKNNQWKRILDFCDTVSKPELRRIIERRILRTTYDGTFDKLYLLPEQQAEEIVALARQFVNEYCDLSQIAELPLIDRQKWQYVFENNIRKLICLKNYGRVNYDNAPYIRKNDEILMLLPEHLFSIKDRDIKRENTDRRPRYYIDSVKREGSILYIKAHLYFRRVNCFSTTWQTIQAYLYNEITGSRMELSVNPAESTELTAAQGRIFNYDDYQYYDYNYDGAGFIVKLDLNKVAENVDKDDFSGSNLIEIQFSNEIDQGSIILSGISKKDRIKNNGIIECTSGGLTVLYFDKSDTLRIRFIRDEMKESEIISNCITSRAQTTAEDSLQHENESLKRTLDDIIEQVKRLQKHNNNQQRLIATAERTVEETKRELKNTREQLERDRRSWNWRIGSAITWLPKRVFYFFMGRGVKR